MSGPIQVHVAYDAGAGPQSGTVCFIYFNGDAVVQLNLPEASSGRHSTSVQLDLRPGQNTLRFVANVLRGTAASLSVYDADEQLVLERHCTTDQDVANVDQGFKLLCATESQS